MSGLEIWTGGQTGVDMGAALAALDAGASLGGFMPADARNEDGEIPSRVAQYLRRHDRTDPSARTLANVGTADSVLVIVPDRRRAGATRGTALTIRSCEKRERRDTGFRLLVVDPLWGHDVIAATVGRWPRPRSGRPLRLMVAGPRASLWPEGEEMARRIVRRIAEELK